MIGVFDSGLGGLSSLVPLRRMLPEADIVYLADTDALPLGEKSDEEIVGRVLRALGFFSALGADAVLLACGTASSIFPEECKAQFTFPIFNIIDPTASAVKQLPKRAKTVLIATNAAVRSGRFAAALARGNDAVLSLPCPSLVSLAEGKRPPTDEAIARAVFPLPQLHPDAVVLGCTHFSLLSPALSRLLPHARLFDAAACGAAALAAGAHAESVRVGKSALRFFITGDARPFEKGASRILGYPVRAEPITLPSPDLFHP